MGADLGPGRGEERQTAAVAKLTLARAWLSIALLYIVVVFPLGGRERERESKGASRQGVCVSRSQADSVDARVVTREGGKGRGGEAKQKRRKRGKEKRWRENSPSCCRIESFWVVGRSRERKAKVSS